MNRRVLSQGQPAAELALSDGSSWNIFAANERTSLVVSRFAATMQLRIVTKPLNTVRTVRDEPALNDTANFMSVTVEDRRAGPMCNSQTQDFPPGQEIADGVGESRRAPVWTSYRPGPSDSKEIITCILTPTEDDDEFVGHLMQISMVIAKHAEDRGAVLLHGALAEKDGFGVVLAGPGEAGKTTASRRLASPWRSLCDDATLVVCDDHGIYWGHPWPTWSKFMFGGAGGTWDVQHAIRLRGIFLLEQAQEEQFDPLGTAQTVCLLSELAEQASQPMSRWMKKDEARVLRLQRFDNICALATTVPCFRLRLSRNGAFWQEIEQALDG